MSKALGIKVPTVNNGYAQIVQHSISPENKEITTFSVKYGLIVHAEFLRHRELSRGVKSNRAIPCKKIRGEVLNDPYVPVWFGATQSGMSANVEVKYKAVAKALWLGARYPAVFTHWLCDKFVGGHKEWVNRILNPWQWVRETITSTEWKNFYELRIHSDAQKDIRVIAEAMKEAQARSAPMVISPGEWHVPYVNRERVNGELIYIDNDLTRISAGQATKASAARCARSSYDNHDGTITTVYKDLPLYRMLVESEPKHASPVEHPATPVTPSNNEDRQDPINHQKCVNTWEDGITHLRKDGSFGSGNFVDFIQLRHLL
jgi:hypothetical protein